MVIHKRAPISEHCYIGQNVTIGGTMWQGGRARDREPRLHRLQRRGAWADNGRRRVDDCRGRRSDKRRTG